MEKARIAIFEDNPDFSMVIGAFMRSAGHIIVGTADSMAASEKLIRDLPADGVDVALVDGNLTPGESDGRDGRKIAGLIHDKFRQAVVVGLSLGGEVPGADRSYHKKDAERISHFIAALRNRQ